MAKFKLYCIEKWNNDLAMVENAKDVFAKNKKKARVIGIKLLGASNTDLVTVTRIRGNYPGMIQDVIGKECNDAKNIRMMKGSVKTGSGNAGGH